MAYVPGNPAVRNHPYNCDDRVEVSIRDGLYPERRWVRRGTVIRTYNNQIDVRFDDSTHENAFTFPTQKDWVRKLSILELIAEAAQ